MWVGWIGRGNRFRPFCTEITFAGKPAINTYGYAIWSGICHEKTQVCSLGRRLDWEADVLNNGFSDLI